MDCAAILLRAVVNEPTIAGGQWLSFLGEPGRICAGESDRASRPNDSCGVGFYYNHVSADLKNSHLTLLSATRSPLKTKREWNCSTTSRLLQPSGLSQAFSTFGAQFWLRSRRARRAQMSFVLALRLTSEVLSSKNEPNSLHCDRSMGRRKHGKTRVAEVRGLAVSILACAALSGCAGRPSSAVLVPVTAPGNGERTVQVLAATTLERATDSELDFTADRAPNINYQQYVVSIPPNHVGGKSNGRRRRLGTRKATLS
jgi:hypothetical protein